MNSRNFITPIKTYPKLKELKYHTKYSLAATPMQIEKAKEWMKNKKKVK